MVSYLLLSELLLNMLRQVTVRGALPKQEIMIIAFMLRNGPVTRTYLGHKN